MMLREYLDDIKIKRMVKKEILLPDYFEETIHHCFVRIEQEQKDGSLNVNFPYNGLSD